MYSNHIVFDIAFTIVVKQDDIKLRIIIFIASTVRIKKQIGRPTKQMRIKK